MNELSRYNLTVNDLPEWMKPRQSRFDWVLLALLALIGVVILPLVWRDGIPNSLGARIEMVRIWEVAETLRFSNLYPRWAPDFNNGYGSPVFNYLAPLPHWFGGIHQAIFQTSAQTSLRFTMAFTIGLNVFGVCVFTRRRFGVAASFFAPMLFLLSPYSLIIAPYLTTDMGEQLAIGLFIFCLWSIDGTMRYGRGRDIVLQSSLVTLLLLSEDALSLLLFVLAIVWYLLNWILEGRKDYIPHGAGAFGLGLGMSSIYGVPLLMEQSAVRWHTATTLSAPSSNLTADLWPTLDSAIYNQSPHLVLGITLLFFTPLALLWLGRHILREKSSLIINMPLVYFTATMLLLLMPSVLGQDVKWRPLTGYSTLYSHDLLGIITLSASIISGVWLAILLPTRQLDRRQLGFLIVLIVFLLISLVQLVRLPDFIQVNQDQPQQIYAEFLNDTHLPDTLEGGVLLPRQIQSLPDIAINEPSMMGTLPAGVQTIYSKRKGNTISMLIDAPRQTNLELPLLYFPGWRALLDDESISVNSADDSGLIVLSIPAGQHSIELNYTETPIQRWSAGVSAVALVMTLLIGYSLEREKKHTNPAKIALSAMSNPISTTDSVSR